ncbi:MAG: hypothetical protein ACRC1H_04570, partial [Caldilineaceae bacterium]
MNQRVGVRGSVRFMAGDSLPLVLADKVQLVGDATLEPAPALVATPPEPAIEPQTLEATAQLKPVQPVRVQPPQAVAPVAHTTRVA